MFRSTQFNSVGEAGGVNARRRGPFENKFWVNVTLQGPRGFQQGFLPCPPLGSHFIEMEWRRLNRGRGPAVSAPPQTVRQWFSKQKRALPWAEANMRGASPPLNLPVVLFVFFVFCFLQVSVLLLQRHLADGHNNVQMQPFRQECQRFRMFHWAAENRV